eukprot:3245242-Pleurochrysis_carterae.AAC.1
MHGVILAILAMLAIAAVSALASERFVQGSRALSQDIGVIATRVAPVLGVDIALGDAIRQYPIRAIVTVTIISNIINLEMVYNAVV